MEINVGSVYWWWNVTGLLLEALKQISFSYWMVIGRLEERSALIIYILRGESMICGIICINMYQWSDNVPILNIMQKVGTTKERILGYCCIDSMDSRKLAFKEDLHWPQCRLCQYVFLRLSILDEVISVRDIGTESGIGGPSWRSEPNGLGKGINPFFSLHPRVE